MAFLYFLATFSSVLVPGIAAFVQARGATPLQMRRGFTVAAFVLGAVFEVGFALAASAQLACFCQCAAEFALSLNIMGCEMSYNDLAGDSAGTLAGVGNTIANVPGIIGPPIAAMVLSASGGDWSANIHSIAALYLIAAAVFGAFCSTDAVAAPTSAAVGAAAAVVMKGGGCRKQD